MVSTKWEDEEIKLDGFRVGMIYSVMKTSWRGALLLGNNGRKYWIPFERLEKVIKPKVPKKKVYYPRTVKTQVKLLKDIFKELDNES